MPNFVDTSTLQSVIDVALLAGNVLMLTLIIRNLFQWSIAYVIENFLLYRWNSLNDSAVWQQYTKAFETLLSPDFLVENAIELPSKPLTWTRKYRMLPAAVRMTNKNHYLLMEVKYWRSQPRISGGPLDSPYTLRQILFKWRPTKGNATESVAGNEAFTLEMHAVHVKREWVPEENADENTSRNRENIAVVIIKYVVQASETHNDAFEEILSQLKDIEEPESSCNLVCLPVSWLLPRFRNYYYYIFQEPTPNSPFAKGFQWIISPVKQVISKQQMTRFRQFFKPKSSMEMIENDAASDNSEILHCFDMDAAIN